MTAARAFTDEELTAYLDRELDASTRELIRAALEDDADLRRRLDAMAFPIEPLGEAFDALLTAVPPMPDIPQEAAIGRASSVPAALVAMAACLIVGVMLGTGWMARDAQARDWKAYVAAYHLLYVNGTLSEVDNSPDETALMLKQLGAVLSRDLDAAQDDAVLEFKRGQVLGFEGQPLIQLAYLSPVGDPVALCIIRAVDARDTAVTKTELEGLAAAQWERDGYAFLLIGGTDAAMIKDAADRFSSVL